MSLGQKITKLGKLSSIYVASDLILYGLGFALMGVFTYYLKPEQMGIVRLAGQIMAPVGILMQLGLFTAMKVWYFRTDSAQRPDLLRTIFLGQVGQGMAFLIILGIAGVWLARPLLPNLPLDAHQTYLLWLMIVFCCGFRALIQLGRSLAVLQERALTAAGVTFLHRLSDISFGVVAVIGLGWLGMGRQFAVTIAMALAACVGLWIGLRASVGGRFRWPLLAQAERTGISFIPHQLSGLMAPLIIAWLVNKLDSTATLGIYAVGLMFAQLIEMPVTAVTNAAYPTLAGLMKEGTDEARRQHSRIFTLVIMGLCLMALGLAIFSPLAIRILSKDYHEAMAVVTLLVFAYLWQGMYRLVGQSIFYFGGGLWLAAVSASSIAVSLLLSLLLIPQYGMYGASWALFGCFATRFFVAFAISQRMYRLRWEVSRVARAIGIAAALGVLDMWLAGAVTMPLAMTIVVKLLVFALMVGLIPLTGIISRADLGRAKQLIRDKFRARANRNHPGPNEQDHDA